MAKKAIVSFGRMNPMTSGHQKLVTTLVSIAKREGATPLLYLSHSQDSRKNPLSYEEKIKFAKKAFGKIVQKSRSKTIIEVLKELEGKYNEVIVVAGGDRIKEFDSLIKRYNGRDYTFDSIRAVSAGQRDPDAEDVSGMSASKLRALVVSGDYDKFVKGLPPRLNATEAKKLYDVLRKNMNIEEAIQEALNMQQRLKRRQLMRRLKGRIKIGRRKAKYRVANKQKLTKRSQKQARQLMRKKLAGKQGERYRELPISARQAIDKKLEKKKTIIQRIAKRLMPKVRKGEYERVKKARESRSKKNESYSFNVDGKIFDLNEHEYLKLLDFMIDSDLKESIKRNLQKKSDKYGIEYSIIENRFIELKKNYDDTQAFDRLNIWLIRETNQHMKRTKERIKNEKTRDKTKHDQMKDRARLRDTIIKNRKTRP